MREKLLIATATIAIIGVMPVWPYSRHWSIYVPAGMGLLLIILLILLSPAEL